MKAILKPHDYVIKPQKEGGGNNFFDQEAKDLLLEFINDSTTFEKRESLKQYLIMARINPPMTKVWMLRDAKLFSVDALSELGLFSLVMIDSAKDSPIFENETSWGYLMRTKATHSNEGGVSSGHAVIDQPVLFEGSFNGVIAPNVNSFEI